jgi:hypothetical protein
MMVSPNLLSYRERGPTSGVGTQTAVSTANDPAFKALVASVVIAGLWAFGGAGKTAAAFILIVALISRPKGGGSSAIEGMLKGFNTFLWGR